MSISKMFASALAAMVVASPLSAQTPVQAPAASTLNTAVVVSFISPSDAASSPVEARLSPPEAVDPGAARPQGWLHGTALREAMQQSQVASAPGAGQAGATNTGSWDAVMALRLGAYVEVSSGAAPEDLLKGKLDSVDADTISVKTKRDGVKTLQRTSVQIVKTTKHPSGALLGAAIMLAGATTSLIGTLSNAHTLSAGQLPSNSSTAGPQLLGLSLVATGAGVMFAMHGNMVVYQR